MKYMKTSKLMLILLLSAFFIVNCGQGINVVEKAKTKPITEDQYINFLNAARVENAKLTSEMKKDVAEIDTKLKAAKESKNEASAKEQIKAKADRIAKYYAEKKEALKKLAAEEKHGGFTGDNYAKDAQLAIHALIIQIKGKPRPEQVAFAKKMCIGQGKDWKDEAEKCVAVKK